MRLRHHQQPLSCLWCDHGTDGSGAAGLPLPLRSGRAFSFRVRVMTEIVDRVARAIAEANGRSFVANNAPYAEQYRRFARAAIAALREPTDSMIDAGMKEAECDLASEYRAMIDCALGKGA